MATYYLDPDGDIYQGPNVIIVGAHQHMYKALDKKARNPAAPTTDDYVRVNALTSGLNFIIDLSSFFKLPISTITNFVVNFYATGSGAGDIQVSLINRGGAVLAYDSYSPSSTAWNTLTYTSGDVDQQFIEDTKLKFLFTNTVTSPWIYAVYIAVNTTESGLQFTAPAESFTPPTKKVWRPRIKPGAFWI